MEYAALTSLMHNLEDGKALSVLVNKDVIGKVSKELNHYMGDASLGLTLLLKFLNAVQHACRRNSASVAYLVEAGILNLMTVTFKRMLDILTRDGCTSESLQAVIELSTETINVIADSGAVAKKSTVLTLLPYFVDLLKHRALPFQTRMEVLKSTNMLLEQASTEIRDQMLQKEAFSIKIVSIVNLIKTIGDYEFQVGLVECLMRLFPKKSRQLYASKLFSDKDMMDGFLNIKDKNFEVDCRVFLNEVNAKSEDPTQGVFSFPCESASVGDKKLEKPSDAGYEEFWVDFNIGSQRITLFCEQQDTMMSQCSAMDEELWETIAICKADVEKCVGDVHDGKVNLVISLKNPLCEIYPSQHQNMTSNKIVIQFDMDLEAHISHAVGYTFSSWTTHKVSTVRTPLEISTKEVQFIDSQSQQSYSSGSNQKQSAIGSQEASEKKCRVSVPLVAMTDPCSTPRSTPVLPNKPVERKTNSKERNDCQGSSATNKQSDQLVTGKKCNQNSKTCTSSCNTDDLSCGSKHKENKTSKKVFVTPKTPSASKNAKPKVKTPVVTVTPPFRRTRARLAKENCESKVHHENKQEVNDSKQSGKESNKMKQDDQVVIPDSLPWTSCQENIQKQKQKVSKSVVKMLDDSGVGIDDSRSTLNNVSLCSVSSKPSSSERKAKQCTENCSDVKQSTNHTNERPSQKKNCKQAQKAAPSCKSSKSHTGVNCTNKSKEDSSKSLGKTIYKQGKPADIKIAEVENVVSIFSDKMNSVADENDCATLGIELQGNSDNRSDENNDPNSIPDSVESLYESNENVVECSDVFGSYEKFTVDKENGSAEEKSEDKVEGVKQIEETISASRNDIVEIEKTAADKKGKAAGCKSRKKSNKCKNEHKLFTDVNLSLKELCDIDVERNKKGTKSCDTDIDLQRCERKEKETKQKNGQADIIDQKLENIYSFSEPDKDFSTDVSVDKKSLRLDKKQKKCKVKTAHTTVVASTKKSSNEDQVSEASHRRRSLDNFEKGGNDCAIDLDTEQVQPSSAREDSIDGLNENASSVQQCKSNKDIVVNDHKCEVKLNKTEREDNKVQQKELKKSESRTDQFNTFSASDNAGSIKTDAAKDHCPDLTKNYSKAKKDIKEKSKKHRDKKGTAAMASLVDAEKEPNKMNKSVYDEKQTAGIVSCSSASEESDVLFIESDDSYNVRRFRMDANTFHKSEKKKKSCRRSSQKVQRDFKAFSSDSEVDLHEKKPSEKLHLPGKGQKAGNTYVKINDSLLHHSTLTADSVEHSSTTAEKKQAKNPKSLSPSHEVVEHTQFDKTCSFRSGTNANKDMVFNITYSHSKTKFKAKRLIHSYSVCKPTAAYDPYDFDAYCENTSVKSDRLNQYDISKDFKKRYKMKKEAKSDFAETANASVALNQSKSSEKQDQPRTVDDSIDTSIIDVEISPECTKTKPLLIQDKITHKWHRNQSYAKQQKVPTVERHLNEHRKHAIEQKKITKEQNTNRYQDLSENDDCINKNPNAVCHKMEIDHNSFDEDDDCTQSLYSSFSKKKLHDKIKQEDTSDAAAVECMHDSSVHMELDNNSPDCHTFNTFSKMVKDFEASRVQEKNPNSGKQSCKAGLENNRKDIKAKCYRHKEVKGGTSEQIMEINEKVMNMAGDYREIERMRRMSPHLDISIGDISMQTPKFDDSDVKSLELGLYKPKVKVPLHFDFMEEPQLSCKGTPKALNQRGSQTRKRTRRRKSVSYKDLSDSDDSNESSKSEKSVEASLSILNTSNNTNKSEKSWILERKKPSKKKELTKTYCRPNQSVKWSKTHYQSEEDLDDVKERDMEITSLPVPSISVDLDAPDILSSSKGISVGDFENATPSFKMSDLDIPECSGSVKSRCSSKFSFIAQSERSESSLDRHSSIRNRMDDKKWPDENLQNLIEMPASPDSNTERKQNDDDNIEEIQTQENNLTTLNMSFGNNKDDGEIDEIGSVCMSSLLKTPQSYLHEEDVKSEIEGQSVLSGLHCMLPVSGLMSGPSSEVRPSRSTLKRKFPDIVTDSDSSNTSDEESDDELEKSTFIPKKLFKLDPSVVPQTKKPQPSLNNYSDGDMEVDCLQSNVTLFMNRFGADVQRQMQVKRKHFETLTSSVQKQMQKHFNQTWMEQQQYYSNTNDNYKSKMVTELSKLEKDINKLKEVEMKTKELYDYQVVMLRGNETSQMNSLKTLRSIHEDHRGRTKKVIKYNNKIQASMQEELKKDMANLKQKLVQDAQKHELENMKMALQKLF